MEVEYIDYNNSDNEQDNNNPRVVARGNREDINPRQPQCSHRFLVPFDDHMQENIF